MRVYKRLALISLALWVASTVISTFVTNVRDTRRADLAESLADFYAIKGQRRILLVGSSSVVLGLSAGQLTQVSGIPVLNAGVLNVRQRFDEYFGIVMASVQPDDVVLVSPPVGIIVETGSQPFGCENPSGLECIVRNWKPAPLLLQFIRTPAYMSGWPHRSKNGDMVFERNAPPPNAPEMAKPMFSRNSVGILRQQIEMIRAHGACAVVAFPPKLVLDTEKVEWEQEFAHVVAEFKAAGLDGALVGSMMVHTNRSYFRNVDHLSAAGRDVWTHMVLKDLKETGRCGMTWDAKREG